MKVLIVDDEQDTLEFLSYNLREANFTVIKSSDGIDALNKIKSENPDIAILDIMMPSIDGIEVCQEVRDSGNNNIIIVILSARNENYTKIAAYKAGCNDFITKPKIIRVLLSFSLFAGGNIIQEMDKSYATFSMSSKNEPC